MLVPLVVVGDEPKEELPCYSEEGYDGVDDADGGAGEAQLAGVGWEERDQGCYSCERVEVIVCD